MIIDKYRRKRRIKDWMKKEFSDSIEYYYAQELRKYKFDPAEVTVWYIDKVHNYMQFSSNCKLYELRDGEIKKITDKDVWIYRFRYDRPQKKKRKTTKKKTTTKKVSSTKETKETKKTARKKTTTSKSTPQKNS